MRRTRADRRAAGEEEEEDAVAEADLDDPNPDVQELFRHYDALYFRGALTAARFTVQWGTTPASSSFGSCTFSKLSNNITLSEPVLKYRSCTDRKKALLHEMIHAIIYVKHHKKHCFNHGPVFRAWMDAINSCSIKDPQRPAGGYNITTRHDFSREEPQSFRGLLWECEDCGDKLTRASNLGPPSDACCIENVADDTTCGNMLCHWHNHKNECDGSYEKMGLHSITPVQKKVMKGAQLLLTCPSETSQSQGAILESDSAELQENTKVTKPNTEDKHLLLVSGSNAKSPGSSSSMKAGKRSCSEVVHKASVLPAEHPKKLKPKQSLGATEKDLFSPVGCNEAKLPGSSTSKKAGKRHRPEDVQKHTVRPVAPLGKLELKQEMIPTEKHKFFSLESCNDKKSLGSSSLQKAGKRHRSAVVYKANFLPAEPPKEMKRKRALVVMEEHELCPPACCNDANSPGSSTSKNAGKPRMPEEVRKLSDLAAMPLGKLKPKPKPKQNLVPTETQKLLSLEAFDDAKSPGSNTKASKRHKPESAQKTCSQPAYPLGSLKTDLVALEKNELFHAICFSNETILDRSSSRKALKQHEPEDIQKTTVLPAGTGRKRKESSFVASKKQKRRCRRKPARGKEFAVMSKWMNIYESDGSSGSTKPLVNKRTERRKRERERILTYSRSKKKASSAPNFRMDSVSSHEIEINRCKDEPTQQSKPLSPRSYTVIPTTADQMVTSATGDRSQPSAPCLNDVLVLTTADEAATEATGDQSHPASCLDDIVFPTTADQVVTQATGDLSQPSAPCLDIVPLQPADVDPPGSVPSDACVGLDIINISDDD